MAVVLVLFCAGIAGAQEYPILDMIANKVIAEVPAVVLRATVAKERPA